MKVTVVGVGNVGLAYSIFLAKKGMEVTAVDINKEYIENLQNGTFKSMEPGVNENLKLIHKFSSDCDNHEGDLCVVLVDTPTCYAGYDHTNLTRALDNLPQYEAVIVAATTQPGFMAKNYAQYYYSPLFIDLGNIITHEENVRNVLMGGPLIIPVVSRFLEAIYGPEVNIHKMSHTAAEVAKLSLNCMLTTKISFANMIGEGLIKSGQGNEIENVLDFVGSDPRIGNKYIKFGWGYGGPCFPRDNRALCTYLRTWGAADYIPIATHETNERHAITMARREENELYDDFNYKPNCPVRCETESHKKKAKQIKESMF
tara:strand:+ start:2181 stop:3125 length:945 start_codon:yes stop_codon:yes gene_type:complete